MIRTQLYLKVVFDNDDAKDAQKVAAEIARTVKRLYGVRQVEIQNTMSEDLPKEGKVT